MFNLGFYYERDNQVVNPLQDNGNYVYRFIYI
jgi:hypothetical protein